MLLDGLAAAAAHELGTPLATIVLITKELQSSKHKWPDIEEDVQLLRSQAERCRDILRTLTRSPGAQDDPHHVSLPVTQLLQEAAMPHATPAIKLEISAHAQEPGTDTSTNREPIAIRRPGVIYGLGNIVENATDFAETKVEVQARWTERDLVITIADDGPGFAPDIIDTLGEPYVTTRPSGKRLGHTGHEASGLGLGFFIAKTLLERSGARIALENRMAPAHGAIVRVSWPRSEFDLIPAGREQHESGSHNAYA
ncbi:MAG: ATP-binding protein [Hyphomicrobiaceae bacterium]